MLRKKRAFTLVEIMIVLAVFATATTMASAIFVASSKAQRKVGEIQKLQGDARYTFEALVREIRGSKIAYNYYQDPDGNPATNDAIDLTVPLGSGRNNWGNPNMALVLNKTDGTEVKFRLTSGAECLTSPCLTVNSLATHSTWVSLTPEGIAVRKLLLAIRPAISPYTDAGPSEQPSVVMQIATETVASKAEEVAHATYQTTVVSRQYGK